MATDGRPTAVGGFTGAEGTEPRLKLDPPPVGADEPGETKPPEEWGILTEPPEECDKAPPPPPPPIDTEPTLLLLLEVLLPLLSPREPALPAPPAAPIPAPREVLATIKPTARAIAGNNAIRAFMDSNLRASPHGGFVHAIKIRYCAACARA